MSALFTFLKEEAERLRAEKPMREAKVREWQAAVARLLEQARGWIREADPENLLKTEALSVPLAEQGLGFYEAPGMRIWLDERYADLLPAARQALAPVQIHDAALRRQVLGRVDLTDGTDRYFLYRIETEKGEEWRVSGSGLPPDGEPLLREVFERLLVRLLK